MSKSTGDPESVPIEDWMKDIHGGKLGIPSFQRNYVWDTEKVKELLFSCLNQKPVGTLLTMKYRNKSGDDEFFPQALSEAPDLLRGDITLVLDGQQRLTALYKAFTDTYYTDSGKTNRIRFFIKVRWSKNSFGIDAVQTKKVKSSSEQDTPKQLWAKRELPLDFLCKHWILGNKQPFVEFCKQLEIENAAEHGDIISGLYSLESEIKRCAIWHFQLNQDSPFSDAVDAYVKLNTNSVNASALDIALPRFQSFHKNINLREQFERYLEENQNHLKFFRNERDVREHFFKVSCLLSSRQPTLKRYCDKQVLDFLASDFETIEESFSRTVEFLEEECVYDAKRLPTRIVLQVVPALYISFIQRGIDDLGALKKLIRSFCWMAFLTDRYNESANSRLYEDFTAMQKLVRDVNKSEDIYTLLRKNVTALYTSSTPSAAELAKRDIAIPTGTDRLARAILIVSLRNGARDLASDEPVSMKNVSSRQYHHIFPRRLLEDDKFPKARVNHALNIALISDQTNRALAAKPPVLYLEERLNINISEKDIQRRLESHLIPFDELKVKSGKGGKYEKFLKRRAELIVPILAQLAHGEHPMVLSESQKIKHQAGN